jgi:uncharacterized protein YegP (UPF0339 family)
MFGLRSALAALGLFAFCATAAAADLKFELYKDKAGEYRWRLKAANGEIMATPGQGYKAMADAKSNIESVKKSATDEKMKYEVYEDNKKEHRWRLKASNGQVIAASSEGYKAKAGAEKAVETIKSGLAKATVTEVDEKEKK